MNSRTKVIILLPLLVFCLSLFITPVHSQNQNPVGATMACDNISDPEYNSLRPYQGNTKCTSQTASEASFCGNELTLKETITETYPGSGGTCTTKAGKIYCTYNVSVPSHSIAINLSGAELPIMGNTEDVTNSQSSTDSLNDAEKMNGYASWYLNGVVNRAEYGTSKNSYNTVNFSGPIQKLYPSALLEAQRIDSINGALKETNHNQIVVCATTGNYILDTLNIGKAVPTECYKGNGSKAQGQVFRLKADPNPILDDVPVLDKILNTSHGWDEQISWLRTITNIIPGGVNSIVDGFVKILPNSIAKDLIQTAVDTSISAAWNKATPPLPWNDGTGRPFTSELAYDKAYNEWHGQTCIVIPLINRLTCLDNIFIPNKYADLFPYIPLSTTEDVPGEIIIDKASSATNAGVGGVTVKNINLTGDLSSTLSFPHLAETNELGELLQNTYTPKGSDKNGDATNISTKTSCNTVEVRSNPGDNLFASGITGNLSYTASFSCVFDANTSPPVSDGPICLSLHGGCVPNSWTCNSSYGSLDCGSGYKCGMSCSSPVQTQTCSKDIYISLSTKTKVPLMDEIWSRLVAGPMSVFKRIFPKTNTEGSVGQIMDIPGSTNVTYSGTNVTTSNTDLKFPHVGGISEYFLNGIQTALRPKGYGESLTFDSNQMTSQNGVASSLCDSSCNSDPTNVNLSGVKEKFIDLAGRWVGSVPGNPRIDMYDTVVNAAKSAGVDPIFVLAIWLHESGGSNYLGICNNQGAGDPGSEFCQKVQDFGINDPSIETYYNSQGKVTSDHLTDQLNAFLDLPGYYKDVCGSNSTAKCSLEYFYAMYYVGQCNPINKTNNYGASIKSIYSALSSQNFACYPIKLN